MTGARASATGRGVELGLLVFAAGLVTLALVLVQIGQHQPLAGSLLYLGVAYLALFALAHAALRWWAPYADPVMLPCVALLNGLGLVMIHRLDLAQSAPAEDGPFGVAGNAARQLLWTAVGVGLFVVVLWFVSWHRDCVLGVGAGGGVVGPVVVPEGWSTRR